MFNNATASARNAFFSITFAALVLFNLFTGAAWAQDCQTELGGSTGYVALTSGDTTDKEKKIDEWSGDVIKIRTSLPGVLSLTGTGPRAQTTLYAKAVSGTHPLLDTARLGSGSRELPSIIKAGDHCIQVTPPPGVTTGNLKIVVTFTDVCHLGDLDDHGDSFVCASALTVGGSAQSGEIASTVSTEDFDIFVFDLSGSATVTVESTGSTDVEASLYDSDGDLVASDDDSGASTNFLITQSLSAGRYYVRVEGANGSYSVTATQ